MNAPQYLGNSADGEGALLGDDEDGGTRFIVIDVY